MHRARARLSRVFTAFIALSASSACLRLAETPDDWPCEDDGDCENGELCVAGRCQGESGEADACKDCFPPFTCRDSKCVDTRRTCIEAGDPSCSPFACELTRRRCLDTCDDASDCINSRFVCRAGSCVLGDCSATMVEACSPYSCFDGACETTCNALDACAPGFICRAGTCVEPTPDGFPCESSDDCNSNDCCPAPGGSMCVATCRTIRPGDTCTFDAECLSESCVAGTCGPCETSSCTAAVCGDMECGQVHGASCGTCSGELVCSGGRCLEIQCPRESASSCDGDDLVLCRDGIITDTFQCSASSYCSPAAGDCVPYTCPASEGFCDDDVFYACDHVGLRIEGARRACAEESLACFTRGCGRFEVDTTDAAGAVGVDPYVHCGNVYEVSTRTVLAYVTRELGFTGGFDVYTFVFAAATPNGPFEQVGPTTQQLGSTMRPTTSLELDVPLLAPGYYFIGMSTNGRGGVAQAGAPAPTDVSFGRMLHGGCSPVGLQPHIETLVDVGVVPQSLTTFTVE